MTRAGDFVIETHSLSKSFGDVQALRGVDFSVPRHSIFGFLGPNGAGKTTLMKLLLGLSHPTSGSGTIFGHDIVNESVPIRERIGYLPQQPRFIDYMTARENLLFAANFFFNGPQAKIRERCEEMLELVGLADKADRPTKGFSGGEKQRLGIALAQVNYPDLLILDDVQRVSDTVAILNRGQIVASGPIETILNGKDGVVYTVTVKGNPDGLGEQLARLPWVTNSTMAQHNGSSIWQVSVGDEAAAEAQLLRYIQGNPQVTVTEFSRKKYDLEEVFMEIVKGDGDGH